MGWIYSGVVSGAGLLVPLTRARIAALAGRDDGFATLLAKAEEAVRSSPFALLDRELEELKRR